MGRQHHGLLPSLLATALLAAAPAVVAAAGRGARKATSLRGPYRHDIIAAQLEKWTSAARASRQIDSCGPLATFPNARPVNYEDARKTKYDTENKTTVEVTFEAGDEIDFECMPGFSTDGTKDGPTTFVVNCSDLGYYQPSGVCLEASKCGPVPTIEHAGPTGRQTADGVEFACEQGYSLDGQKVVAGGFERNARFELKCLAFSGQYEKFNGECKPYAFMPAKTTHRLYNQVFEALFVVSCEKELAKAFDNGDPPPVDGVCAKLTEGQGACSGLVSTIKGDFSTKTSDLEAHKQDKEWWESHGRPNVLAESKTFCTGLWDLLK